ncbi:MULTISPECIES: TrlF family AAA-like ATPase [unclassified Pseudoxanthomonas]|uniref:TrlF family AAA-like ATPase n=1 Tax=unclassified Pseudoxanthomonas TaxID=2645906 RepID=UPI00307E2C00
MTSKLGTHGGAVWHRTDLQCHTPRDHGWVGSDQLTGGTPETEAARAAWADKFIVACKEKRLTAVAITDHHDIALFRYVSEAAIRDGSGIVVFPGVEITCNDNAQVLALFDPLADVGLVKKLLSKLHSLPATPQDHQDLAKGCVVAPCGLTVEKLFETVAIDVSLRESCLLLPHFSDQDAYKSLNAAGHHPRFVTLDADGIYVERPFGELAQQTVDKIRGKIKEWGTRRRAIVSTGDNRREDWERLGANACWIKLGEPSLEALRQALLADEARICYEEPDLPSERLVGLTIKSTLLGESPVEITFNEGFTAVIGGRGSGKSAILEHLRFVLARRSGDFSSSDQQAVRELHLVEETLGESGFVEARLYREGIYETWRRDLATKDTILITDLDGGESSVSLEEARRRFRARAFYQKSLSTTTAEKSIDQITGIAAAEAVERRREVDQAIRNGKRSVGVAVQQAAAHWQAVLESRQAKLRVQDVQDRLTAVAKLLDEGGISKSTLAIIEESPRYARTTAYLSEIEQVISDDRGRFDDMRRSILNLPPLPDQIAFGEIVQLKEESRSSRLKILEALDAAAMELSKLDHLREGALATFKGRSSEFRERYEEAVKQQAAHKSLIADNERLVAELAVAQRLEASAQSRENDSSGALTALAAEREGLKQLLDDRRLILREAAEKVAGQSGQVLAARLKRDPCPADCVNAVSALLEGSRVHDAADKVEALVSKLSKAEAEGAWFDFSDQILKIYEARIMVGSNEEPSDDVKKEIEKTLFGSSSITQQQATKIYSSLTDEKVSAVLSAVPRDSIMLKYIDDGREIPFSNASPGQQASALLELLLKQEAGPLIIDQPEDDLDNRVVMKIVELIRRSKNRRQLIFATHNPNIVVNGDADKVVALSSGGSTGPTGGRVAIDCDGAIETLAIRENITRIMEGGKEAFDLRSRKYGFDHA